MAEDKELTSPAKWLAHVPMQFVAKGIVHDVRDIIPFHSCGARQFVDPAPCVQAYEVLSDSHSRGHYNEQLQAALIDEMDDYTGMALSKWLANTKMGKNWDANEERAVFVVSSWLTAPSAGEVLPCTGHFHEYS